MAGFENHAGFTITGSKLQIVEINFRNGQFRLNNIDEAYFTEPINFEKEKETKINALLQGAYDELLVRKHLNSNIVSFSLPFDIFYVVQLPYDNTLLHQDLLEEFKWELTVLYPYISSKDLVIQYIEIPKNDIVISNTALVVATNRKYLQLLNNFCSRNRLRLRFVDNVHFSSERALAASSNTNVDGIALSVHISQGFLSLIIAQNSKPVFFKVMQLQSASEIPAFINNELSPTTSKNITKNMIGAAFISGEFITGSIVKTINEQTGINFSLYNPFKNITAEAELATNKFYTEKFNSFSPAAGIAYRMA